MAELQVKGVALVAAIDTLGLDRERFEPHVAPELRKYLDETVYGGDWYPASDLMGLCEAIRLGALGNLERSAAYEALGESTAQRDLFGVRNQMASKEAIESGGAYEGALKKDMDYLTFTRRALSLWQLYYDQGEQVGERTGERSLRIRLVDVKSPTEDLCSMTTGFYKGVVEALGGARSLEHTQCSARGDDECIWVIEYGPAFDPSQLDTFGAWPPDA